MGQLLDCLVIQAPNSPLSERSILIEPVDVLTLATYVSRAGYEVVFCDLDRFGLAPLQSETRQFRVAVVVLDYYIPLHASGAVETLQEVFGLLDSLAEVRLLVGRPSSYAPQLFLDAFASLDGCIIGEAEATLVHVLSSSNCGEWNEASVITRTATRSVPGPHRQRSAINIYTQIPDAGPIADRSLCAFASYIDVHSIVSSRGCTGACTFCSTVHYWGQWRGASATLVLNEFTHVVESGAKKIIFLDDNFADSTHRAFQIASGLQHARFSVPWGCLCRIEDMSDELTLEMAKAGCRWIHFGIEHGTEVVRRSVGKYFTNEQAQHVVGTVKALGIRVRTSWILDLPMSTLESVKATFNLAKSLGSHEVKLHYLALRPGSTYFWQFRQNMKGAMGDMSIHISRPTRGIAEIHAHIAEAVLSFRHDMEADGYRWVDDVRYWRRYDNSEASADDRFLSTVVTRYGLGW